MITWRAHPEERSLRATPLALRLVDDFTGQNALPPVALELSARGDDGVFRASPFAIQRSASGLLTFPGIGRTSSASGKPPVRHRLLVRSPLYEPLYGPFPAPLSGFEFDVPLYDRSTPPPPAPFAPVSIVLLPSTAYPFAASIAVLRGRVLDATSAPVAGAQVVEGMRERVLTDARGAFALPLRWIAPGTIARIDVTSRGGATVTEHVAVPSDLEVERVITLP